MEYKDKYDFQNNNFLNFAFFKLPANKHGPSMKFLKIFILSLSFFFLFQNSSVSGTDFKYLPDGNPQTMYLFASCSQFSDNYTNTITGYINPAYTYNPMLLQAYTDLTALTMAMLPPSILLPPDFRCVAVNPSGNVTLTWIPPIDTTSSFDSYHIYSATSASGPYTEIDSIFNYFTTSYTHIGANANTYPVYYYIRTRSDSFGMNYSSPSDTLETIFLNAVNSGTGIADLLWNPIHNPNLPTSLVWYHIYREYPPGTWILLDSTQQLQYSDTITLCNVQINYYVDINDSLPCTSVSNIAGDVFQDETEPFAPVIDSVSVDSLTGYSVIGWTASSSGDTEGYIIYEYENGIWVPIDTVWGYSNTFYVNSMPYWSNPDSSSLSYSIAAFDSCMNTSPINTNHTTIYLTSVLDVCGGGVTLYWTPYINMNSGLKGYNVYVKENNGSLTLLGTNIPTNQSFLYSSLNQFSTYIFSIQAFDSSGVVTSTSNNDTIYVYVPNQPQFVYLRYVTVRNNNYVDLKAIVDTSGYISNCKIMRAENASGTFINIGNVTVPPLSNTITYNDASANVNQLSYVYKVIAEDSCGIDTIESNIGQTIFLTAEPDKDMKNNLSWNEYANWLGAVSEYRIYRAVDEIWDFNPIVTLSPGTTEYIDDISQFMTSEGKFEYYVEALEGTGNPYLFADTSISNKAIAFQPPRFYVPNAFSPKGLNTVFTPVSVFVDTQDYQFKIYNRWGLIVFQTTDLNTGWDGTFEGEPAPQGVYVYAIQYKNSQNKFIEKHGTVTLLR